MKNNMLGWISLVVLILITATADAMLGGPYIPDTNTVALYRLNNETAGDSTTNGYHGTLFGSGNTWVDSTRYQGGLETPSDTGGGFNASISFTGQTFTVEGWFNPNSIRGTQYLFGGKGSAKENIFYVRQQGTYLVWGMWDPGAEVWYESTDVNANLSVGTWYHVAVTAYWPGSGNNVTMCLYKNNVLRDRDTFTFTTLPNAVTTLKVGRCPWSDTSAYFIGQIDEVRISSMARSGGRATVGPTLGRYYIPDAETVGLYHLNDASGDIVCDATDNGYDGTLYGSSNTWVTPARYQSGLETPSDTCGGFTVDLSVLGDNFTVEGWFNPNSINGTQYLFGGKGSAKENIFYVRQQGTYLVWGMWDPGAEVWYETTDVNANLSAGMWYHVAVTLFRPASGGNNITMSLYQDNILKNSTTFTFNKIPGTITTLKVGRCPWTDYSSYFIGQIDEVRVSSTARKCFSSPFNSPPNLVGNSAFEIAGSDPAFPAVWSRQIGSGNVVQTWDTDQYVSGSYSVKTVMNSSGQADWRQLITNVDTSVKYRFYAHVYASKVVDGSHAIELCWLDDEDTELDTDFYTLSVKDQWEEVIGENIEPPAEAVKVSIRLRTNLPGTYYFDDVVLTKQNESIEAIEDKFPLGLWDLPDTNLLENSKFEQMRTDFVTIPDVPATATVALYHLDEVSGTTVNDGTANGYNGVLFGTGNLWVYPAKYDGGLETPSETAGGFNASLVCSGESFTVEGWFKPNSTSGMQHLLGGRGSAEENIFYVRQNESFFEWGIWDTGTNVCYERGGGSITPGKWYHVALTVFSSGNDVTMSFFQDNVLRGSITIPFTTLPGIITTLKVGRALWSDTSTYFTGQIDEVRVSNTARYGIFTLFPASWDTWKDTGTTAIITRDTDMRCMGSNSMKIVMDSTGYADCRQVVSNIDPALKYCYSAYVYAFLVNPIDATTNTYDGTLFGSGNTWVDSARYQGGLETPSDTGGGFDASISFAGHTFTVEGWFNPNLISNTQYLFGGKGSAEENIFYVRQQGTYLVWGMWDPGAEVWYERTDVNANLSAGTWYHVAVAAYWPGSGNNVTMYLYKNNGLRDSNTFTFTTLPNAVTTLKVGRCPWSDTSAYFTGQIDEVRVSSTAKTSFNTVEAYTPDVDTVALYHLDDGTGPVVPTIDVKWYDASDNYLGMNSASASTPDVWIEVAETDITPPANAVKACVFLKATNIGTYYFAAVKLEVDWNEIARAVDAIDGGFNFVSSGQLERLDYLQSAGLKGAYNTLFYLDGSPEAEEALDDRINAVEDHPALALWFQDEPGWFDMPTQQAADGLIAGYNKILETDDYYTSVPHRVLIDHAPRGPRNELENFAALRTYAPAADIFSMNAYPVPEGNGYTDLPNKTISCIGEYVDIMYNQVVGMDGVQRKPVWTILQGCTLIDMEGPLDSHAIELQWFDSSDTLLRSDQYQSGHPNEWRNVYEQTLMPPSGANKVCVLLRAQKPGTYYFDDITFRQDSGSNLLSNSDFETANGDMPAGWSTDQVGITPIFSWNTARYYSSSHSVKIIVKSSGGWADWKQWVSGIDDSEPYTFSGWIYKQTRPVWEDVRFMAYDAIIHGSRGIFYWGHHYISVTSELWKDMKQLAGELSGLSAVLLSPHSIRDVIVDSSEIETLLLGQGNGHLYLLVANRSPNEVNDVIFTISGLPLSTITRIYETGSMNIAFNSFTDSFTGYQVHVYQINEGNVVGSDLAGFANAFGSVQGEGNYSLRCDMDKDGDVDGTDLAIYIRGL